jgi:hypothetical protein
MRLWCDAVIAHLRRALKARILKSHLDLRKLEQLFTEENETPFLGHLHRPDCFKVSLCGIRRPVCSPIASRTATLVESNGARGNVFDEGHKSKAVGSEAVFSLELCRSPGRACP